MLQFRIIPPKDPKYYHNQTMPEISLQENKEKKQRVIPQRKKMLLTSHQVTKNMKTVQEKQELPQVNNLATSNYFDSSVKSATNSKSKSTMSRNKNNLSKILGFLNIKKGSVSIQSQKVRILEDEEEMEILNTETNTGGGGGFFITEDFDGTLSPNKTSVQLGLKDELVKVVNEKESLRKRLDKQIVNWKLQDPSKSKGFIHDHLTSKKFMHKVGPGSYNLAKTLETHPLTKTNPNSNFLSNSHRLQEMLKLKKQQSKKAYSIASTHPNNPFNESESLLSIIITDPDKKRSKSQLSSITGTGYYKVLKNGQIKESSMDLGYKSILDNSQRRQNPNIRCELVNKQQSELTHIGPGKYVVEGKIGSTSNEHYTNYQLQKQLDRFHYRDKQLEVSRNQPGPGFYEVRSQSLQIDETPEIKLLNGAQFPSFGTKEARELKLVNENSKIVPGPGKYQTQLDLEEMLKKCEDKDLVSAILECTQDRKQSSVFKSKTPSTVVFNLDKNKQKLPGLDQFYTQDQKTIQKSQLEVQAKRLEKIILTGKKEYPTLKEQTSTNQVVDTFQTVQDRFKEDKKLYEMRNLGPGAYYNDLVVGSSGGKKKNSVFQSAVPRMESLGSKKIEREGSQKVLMESGQGEQRNEWEKKSFNMKYNQDRVRMKRSSQQQSQHFNNGQ